MTLKLNQLLLPYGHDNFEDERLSQAFRDVQNFIEGTRKTYAPAFIGFKRDVDAKLRVTFLNGDDVDEVDVSDYDDWFVPTKGVEFKITDGHLILVL